MRFGSVSGSRDHWITGKVAGIIAGNATNGHVKKQVIGNCQSAHRSTVFHMNKFIGIVTVGGVSIDYQVILNVDVLTCSSVQPEYIDGLVAGKLDGIVVKVQVMQASLFCTDNVARIRSLDTIEYIVVNLPILHCVAPVGNAPGSSNEIVVIHLYIMHCQLYSIA
ncbi:hypothetical protein C900_02455 [Fulvivirga imtechensis AK7]|uniref:Uncharacterized protein n=1 Tax=Fulvivirga imtechensis AK7 TaxID=1237149 RepID=L8JWR2_9BACT|nr:hypothetical protein C900_02455 [Fulvivirga imtechensis AK7]